VLETFRLLSCLEDSFPGLQALSTDIISYTVLIMETA